MQQIMQFIPVLLVACAVMATVNLFSYQAARCLIGIHLKGTLSDKEGKVYQKCSCCGKKSY